MATREIVQETKINQDPNLNTRKLNKEKPFKDQVALKLKIRVLKMEFLLQLES